MVASSVPPITLLTRYCHDTGRRKALSPSSVTKCLIWAVPIVATLSVPVRGHVPSVPQPKSKPAMFTPAYLTTPEAAAAAVVADAADVAVVAFTVDAAAAVAWAVEVAAVVALTVEATVTLVVAAAVVALVVELAGTHWE